jgi:prepilin-type N-terminal cleavage/methylation domain-containing protein
MKIKSTANAQGPLKHISQAGLTLVELIIAAGIIAVLLLASASALGESVDSTTMSRELTQGALFLESVQEDLATVSPNDILSMNGQQIFMTEPNADSKYRVEISTFLAAVDLVQVRLALLDNRTGRRVAAVSSLRADV